jgi:hypothetical protein
MKIRSATLLAAVGFAGLAAAAYAQGVFDPGPVPPLPAEEAHWDEDSPEDEALEGVSDEIVYEQYEVVQPIPDEATPAARAIEPPADDAAEQLVEAEAPAPRGKLVRLERAPAAPGKRVRITK